MIHITPMDRLETIAVLHNKPYDLDYFELCRMLDKADRTGAGTADSAFVTVHLVSVWPETDGARYIVTDGVDIVTDGVDL